MARAKGVIVNNPDTREALAAYAHEAWAGWMVYLFAKSQTNPDGTVTIPAGSVERWQRQMSTLYANLPEAEKASDRDEADKMLRIMSRDCDCAGA